MPNVGGHMYAGGELLGITDGRLRERVGQLADQQGRAQPLFQPGGGIERDGGGKGAGANESCRDDRYQGGQDGCRPRGVPERQVQSEQAHDQNRQGP